MSSKVPEWIRQSNLIEGINSREEDLQSYEAWIIFKASNLTLQSILQVHGIITQNQLENRYQGYWRDCQVWIGGFRPPEAWKVPSLMEGWLDTWSSVKEWEDIRQAHIAFETIHPFVDGNGRTGRMIMNKQRIDAGMDPLCIYAKDRWDYYAWFEEQR